MKNRILLSSLLLLTTWLFNFLPAQESVKDLKNVEVSATTAVLLGKSASIRSLQSKASTSSEKKDAMRRFKKVPDNFRARRAGGKAANSRLEHQGPDPLRQTHFANPLAKNLVDVLVNTQGLGDFGSPHDPTGDVSDEYYVQAINVTDIGVYDLEGNLIVEFAMNTLWASFGASSAGDPIVLYDEFVEKWIITEFTDPANLLVAISETKDPLGSYFAYSFSTPNFPDYPKYAVTPEALVVTTNEEGGGTLHQYFLDMAALRSGADQVAMLRVAIIGNEQTEAGFYVTTPADWNGLNLPYDNRPITLTLNDSSWPNGPDQDQIDLYAFNLNFAHPDSTTVDRTSIIVSPFDSYPCSVEGFGFECVPQLDGGGLDAIPELIMNVPHWRNFGTHESLVFNFITDVTDGENQSGIRWMELRRTDSTEWALYQEGTLGLDDGLDRYMGTIAMDSKGNIALAYNVSSEETYVGIRFTGRYATDPLGVMSIPEQVVIDGASPILSGFDRFGDYSQMSVSPLGDNTFWFTTEYATDNDSGTRILALKLERDSFDLAVRSLLAPQTSNLLGDAELVRVEFTNRGIEALADFEIGYFLNGLLIEQVTISDTLLPDSVFLYQFDTPLDMAEIAAYQLKLFIHHPLDSNALNDTINREVLKLHNVNGTIRVDDIATNCEEVVNGSLTLQNLGGEIIDSATIAVFVNEVVVDTVYYTGSLAYNQQVKVDFTSTENLEIGINALHFELLTVNGAPDEVSEDNTANTAYELLPLDAFVTLVFETDDYPQESQWFVVLNDSAIVAQGTFTEAAFTHFERICLPLENCYTLIVTDAFGDGICCDFGEGSFALLNNQGDTLIFNQGVFGFLVEEAFCPGAITCSLSATAAVQDASGPNVADGSIMLEATGGQAPFAYSIDNGSSFQSSPLFENVLPGDYTFLVTDANNRCSFTDTVSVSFLSSTFDFGENQVIVSLAPNPSNGVFKLKIANLPIHEDRLLVEIFNVNGQLIQNRFINRFGNDFVGTFSLFDFPAAHYFIRIVQKDINILQRLVLIK